MASPTQDPSTMSHIVHRLTPWEKLQLFSTLPIILGKGIFSFFSSIAHKRDFSSKALRRIMLSPTGALIASLCAQENLEHRFIHVEAGEFPPATLHFIGASNERNAGNVFLYFHGGGYVFPASKNHFKFARMAAEAANASLVMLEYTLAPELKYPGQLAQATSALSFLLKQFHASKIIIGGDSGGGNLTLSLLSHIRRPHPRIPPVFSNGDQQQLLRGAVCISPRCANDCTAASWKVNASKDIIGRASMQLFTSNWMPDAHDIWATPIRGDSEFWSTVGVDRVLIAAGGDEVYLDDIKRLAGLMGAEDESGARVQLKVCPGEVHVQCVLDLGVGITDGIMLTNILSWLQTLRD